MYYSTTKLTHKQVCNLFFFTVGDIGNINALRSLLSLMLENKEYDAVIASPFNTEVVITRKGCIFYFYLVAFNKTEENEALHFAYNH